MRFFKPYLRAVLILASAVCLWNCSEQELPDNREHDYGYVQFKVYKEASYSPASKAEKDELDYLSEASWLKVSEFSVADNSLTDADVKITLHKTDSYLRDNYILKKIWEALGGPDWSYNGQTYPAGANWDFNKDPDLWSYQPGVQVHPNGRVALIDLSGFGAKGAVPAEIGELSELMELYLSMHNEDDVAVTRSMSAGRKSSHIYTAPGEAEKAAMRKEYREYVSSLNPQYQMSPACALALKMHGLESSAASSYAGMTEEQLFLEGVGGTGRTGVKPASVAPGDMRSGIVSLPPEIGRLTRLEKLNIANCPIYTLGETDEPVEGYTPGIAGLKNLTYLEIYNCPYLDQFPDIAGLSKLISANLTYIVSDSHPYLDELNSLPSLPEGKEITPITGEDVKNGLAAMSRGAVSRTLQELYCIGNCMEEFPSEMKDFADLAMMDFSDNRIETLPRMGKDFDPSELHLENNAITGFTGEGDFCDPDLLTSISLANNKLTEFPDIFRPGAELKIGTIDLSNNQIQGFPDMTALAEDEDFLYVETLNLGGNRIETFPEGFFDHCEADYIIMSNCGMKTVPEGAFDGKYSESLVSLDLQYNRLKDIPDDLNATSAPYLYGVDISYNAFTSIQDGILSCKGLTILGMKGQRTDAGERCFRTWPGTIYQHTGLRAFYAGSNDIRTVPAEQVSTSIFYLEIAGNPNINFDASGICDLWRSGMFFLYYDRSQNITNCEAMLQ